MESKLEHLQMTKLTRWAPLAGIAFALSLGLAACGEAGPEQQSSNPVSEQSGDAAATMEGEMEKKTE